MTALQPFLNRVIHGDCLKVLAQWPDECIDFILTDPPYLSRYTARDGRRLPNDDNVRWMFPAFAQLYRLLKPHRFCVSFYGWHAADRFLQAWRQCGFWPASHFTCVKPYASNVKFARMMHENAYLLAKGEPAQPPLPPADVLYWKYSGNKLHPTQKPVSLLTPLVEAYSRPGDIVLDPFAGSGTTGVAARQCRRRFILIEKDAQYHQAAAQRLSA